MMLRDADYNVDAFALESYAGTPEAASTWASPEEDDALRSRYTERDLIGLFLQKKVNRKPDGTGTCVVSHGCSDVGQALVDAGLLEIGGRLYPDVWPCARQLGKRLRNSALGARYCELDDSNAFHRYLQTLTSNETAKAVLSELANDKTHRARLAEYYFGDGTKTGPIKTLFHALSNDGSIAEWRRANQVKRGIPDHPLVARMECAMGEVTEELASTERGKAAVALLEERFPKKWVCRAGKDGKKKKRLVNRNEKVDVEKLFAARNGMQGAAYKNAPCQ